MLYIAESAYWCRGSHHYVYKQIIYTSEFAIMGVLKCTCQLDGHGGTFPKALHPILHTWKRSIYHGSSWGWLSPCAGNFTSLLILSGLHHDFGTFFSGELAVALFKTLPKAFHAILRTWKGPSTMAGPQRYEISLVSSTKGCSKQIHDLLTGGGFLPVQGCFCVGSG